MCNTALAFQILPLENKMTNPKEMRGWNGVLWTGKLFLHDLRMPKFVTVSPPGMTITTAIYAATGFFGYAKYGDKVASTLTLNMPNTW